LRDRVLGGASDGPGLAVLRTQGLWAWMRVVAAEPQLPAGPQVPVLAASPAQMAQTPALAIFRPPEHRELVRIWAGLLLAGELSAHHAQGAPP
jgi:hypothetical protein